MLKGEVWERMLFRVGLGCFASFESLGLGFRVSGFGVLLQVCICKGYTGLLSR